MTIQETAKEIAKLNNWPADARIIQVGSIATTLIDNDTRDIIRLNRYILGTNTFLVGYSAKSNMIAIREYLGGL